MACGLGIDVGGTKILACALDNSGKLLVEKRVESPASRAELVERLQDVILSLLSEISAESTRDLRVGFGLPGLVDIEGVMHDAANLRYAIGIDVRQELSGLFEKLALERKSERVVVVVDNDGTCAAIGEHAYGAARTMTNALMITLGTGIGAGLIANGRIVRGAAGYAGEVGHMVVHPGGPSCGCGGRGCLEQYASGTGLVRLARELCSSGRGELIRELAAGDLDGISGELVVVAARLGDKEAQELLETFGHYLALGLHNLVEVLDPQAIVIGGGLIAAADTFMGFVEADFATRRRGSGPRAVPIVLSELGERAGAFGAAAMALEFIR